MNFKARYFIIFPIIIFLVSCDTKTTSQAIKYYKDQIGRDSLKFKELISLASIVSSDSFNFTIRNSQKKPIADYSKWTLDHSLIDGNVAEADSLKRKINDQMEYRGITDIALYQKKYVVLKTSYRTKLFKYYQIVYIFDNSAYTTLTDKGYIFFEGDSKPKGKWIYKLFDRWYLNGNGK